MTTKLQVRQKPPKLCYRSMEFRASEPVGDGRTLEGYAAVFDSPTRIETFFGDFEEELARGAFKKTLRERTPVLQFDHGRDMRTGSLPIGSINDLREDEHGLFTSARLFDNDVVEPIRQAIEAEAINGMSFRFRIVQEEWRDEDGTLIKDDDDLFDLLLDDDALPRRTIKEVELFELGPVVFPAYDATSVGVRSMLAQLDEDKQMSCVRDLLASVFTPEQVNRIVQDVDESRNDPQETPGATEGTPDDAEAASSTPASKNAEPTVRHSADLREPADWYLPGPSEIL